VTAINVIRFPNEVHVATDGLSYTGRGPGPLISKVVVIAHLPLVVAVSGSALAAAYFADHFQLRFRSFDHLVDEIEDVYPGLHGRYRLELQALGDDDPNTIVILAGWSAKRGQAEAYAMGAADEGGLVPFKLGPIQGMVGLPPPPMKPHCELRRATVKADIVAMMEVQREMGPDKIGGFIQLTTVTKDAVTQRILKRWTH
jgi:hypothetical protein